MSKYISEECKQCSKYIMPEGCTNYQCPIRQDYEQSMEEMGEDFENDRWIKKEKERGNE